MFNGENRACSFLNGEPIPELKTREYEINADKYIENSQPDIHFEVLATIVLLFLHVTKR